MIIVINLEFNNNSDENKSRPQVEGRVMIDNHKTGLCVNNNNSTSPV